MKRIVALLAILALLLSPSLALAVGVQPVASFASDADHHPTGLVTGPDDSLYAGMTNGEIFRVIPGTGATQVFAQLPDGPINSLTIDPSGRFVYAAVASGDAATHGIWRVDLATRARERYAAFPIGTDPFGLAFHETQLFVSDGTDGRIWRVTSPRSILPWKVDGLLNTGARGLVYSEAGHATGSGFSGGDPTMVDYLYVAVPDHGRIARIRVLPNGGPGGVEVFVESRSILEGVTSIHFNEGAGGGTLYAAVPSQNRIAAVSHGPSPGVYTIVQGQGLAAPWGVEVLHEQIYVTSSDARVLQRIIDFVLPTD